MEKQTKSGHADPTRMAGGQQCDADYLHQLLLVIAVGTLLLTLPISSRTGRLGVIDAMFTATSATCVTGLVVRDTWSQFSLFGQVIILMLIQVGGLGLSPSPASSRWRPGGGWDSATCGCWARASRQTACPSH